MTPFIASDIMHLSDPDPRIARAPAASLNLPLFTAERVVLAMVLGIGLGGAVISAVLGRPVDWPGFLMSFLPSMGLLALGLYLRAGQRMLAMAQFAIAAALYIGFAGVTAILIYLLFPVAFPIIDADLMRIDAMLGYHWPDFVAAMADYPAAARALALVYHSSLPQLFLVIGTLVVLARRTALHKFMLAATISLMITILVWWLAPSFGPSAYHVIPEEMAREINLVTNAAYGAELMRLANEGPGVIRPGEIIGTIAFPSYHTIMACIAVWYVRGTKLLMPMVLLNLAMIPAVLAHGGHHLVDMAGGLLVFVLSAWIARWIVEREQRKGLAG